MSLFTSFNSGVSGIISSQSGLNTTAHNLANTKTAGYSRQQNINMDTYYQDLRVTTKGKMQIGYGTTVSVVRQIRDIFLDREYRLEVGRQGFYEMQYYTQQEIEDVFGEMEGMEFNDALGTLWNTIQSFSTNPESITNRELLITQAASFLQKAQDLNQSLRDYQINLNSQIQEQVKRINELADQISDLNDKVARAEASGLENANDYRDARNLLMDELASYTAFDAYEENSGRVVIRVNNAPLVDVNRSYHMKCEKIELKEPRMTTDLNGNPIFERDGNGNIKYDVVGISPMFTVVWEGSGFGEVYDVGLAFTSANDSDCGSLLGILTARGNKFGYYTDIPQNVQELKGQLKLDVLNEYNKSTGNCLIERIQAQFDLLIHKVVTAINDALAPNVNASLGGFTLTDANGNTVTLAEANVLDVNRCPVGTDDNATPGTELFTRKTMDRYTVYTVNGPVPATDENGNQIFDENGNPVYLTQEQEVDDGNGGTQTIYKLYVYNEEDPDDIDTLYTLQNMEINEKLLENYNYLPVHGNPAAGKSGEYDMDIYANMLASWREQSIVLDPNTLAKYSADGYYDAMIGSLAIQGRVWGDMVDGQAILVENVEDKRQQIAGVSTEEEMTSLLMYQHAFNAASRYITVIDAMLEHLIERLG